MWPLILALAGVAAQTAAAQKVKKNSNSALMTELQRQQRIREEAQQAALLSAQQSTPQAVGETIARGQEERKQAYTDTQAVPLTSSAATAPLQRSATSMNDKRQTIERERSNQARGNLMGYNEWDLQRGIKNLLANQQLALMGNFAQGSQGVLPIELNAAQHSGDSLQGIGQLLSTAGMVGSMGSMFNQPSGAALTSPTYNATGRAMVPAWGAYPGQSMWGNAVGAAAPRYFNLGG